ncbi:protein transport protein sft2 [Allomyces arbusculus]|nr:protein transport protein sft2 [Allomyces arbusculus]
MSESAFQSSLRAFQSSRGASAPAPASGGLTSDGMLGKINPQRWLASLRPDADEGDTARQGLLSGFMSSRSAEPPSRWERMCPELSTYQRFVAFACCTGGGILFFTIAFFMLPVVVVAPQKFAFLSCIGSLLLFSSIGFLRGWGGHMKTVFSSERWPFTLGYLGSLVGGLWSSVVIHSYILTILFIILHTVALIYYYVSFLPGGISGLRSMTGMMGRSILPL